jgi:hypothetical protein
MTAPPTAPFDVRLPGLFTRKRSKRNRFKHQIGHLRPFFFAFDKRFATHIEGFEMKNGDFSKKVAVF